LDKEALEAFYGGGSGEKVAEKSGLVGCWCWGGSGSGRGGCVRDALWVSLN